MDKLLEFLRDVFAVSLIFLGITSCVSAIAVLINGVLIMFK